MIIIIIIFLAHLENSMRLHCYIKNNLLKTYTMFFITLIWKINEIINYELGDMKARYTGPHRDKSNKKFPKQERFEFRFKR